MKDSLPMQSETCLLGDNGWFSCDFCGRDTRNKSRICKHCYSGVQKHTQIERETCADPEGARVIFGFYEVTRDDVVNADVRRAIRNELE